MPAYFNIKVNQGDDAAGIVEAVGSKVTNFRKGDRVAAFHVMDTPKGTYAEYTVAPSHTVFHIPETLSFEEAATIPLAAYTAAVGIFRNLRLPLPFDRTDEHGVENTPEEAKIPLIVNGASSAVGAFAVKLAKLNPTIYPIIGIAGGSKDFAKEIGADAVVDYRSADVVADLKNALGGKKVYHVFDAANTLQSVKYLSAVVEKGARYTCTTPVAGGGIYGKGAQKEILDEHGIWSEQIWVGSVHDNKPAGGILFGKIASALFEEAIKAGTLTGQPYEIVQGGLTGVKDALAKLRDRKGGNTKFVTRIADTPGL